VGTKISDEALRRLVEASRNDDACTERLLQEVLSGVDEIVAALVTDCAIFTGEDRERWRHKIDEQVLSDLIKPSALSAWATSGCAWHFVDEHAHELASRALDRAWIVKAAEERDKRAETLLITRVSALCERAIRRRRLAPPDADDALQEFRLWLCKDDYAALRRWSPDGGRSFDGWFMARAINQIDGWRRRHPVLVELEDEDGIDATNEFQVVFRLHLREIQEWMTQRCTPRQRDVFERWFIRQQNAAEIAQEIDSTPAAVNVMVARLRKAIKAVFDL